MSIVTITLNNKTFKLSCPEDSKEHLVLLAQHLDLEIESMKTVNPSASFELLLVMTALNLMDEKQSGNEKTGGEILENANQNFQQLLSSLRSELNIVAKKVKK
ncbi:MAG: hypothetical protein COA94_06155 [Rickettsiales bacterium]|nr:MAG: hypothetical protein COA94_06155 [Rickettsiales bacterium]